MEYIYDFVKNIVACLLIMNIVECLIASKEYGKYIKLFTGIIVIVAIMEMGEGIIDMIWG